ETTSSQSLAQLVPNWYESFKKLAPIDKQTIRQHPGLFMANADDVVYRGMTSGSRGESFIYFAGTEWNETRTLARRRSLHWWGIDDRTPIINVASRLMPVRTIDVAIAGLINSDFIQLLLTLLNQRPVALRGYPSRLCEVATKFYGCRLPPVIAVICTGECLFDYQRTLLEAIFQAPVIEEYGCQETGISGLTCPEAGRLHLDSDRCLYEIIDGQLVTTDLFNRIMPLVRYKSGDLIELNSQTCPCGRSGLTGNILGRIEDGVRTLDGIKYPGEITMPPLDGILNYQVLRREGTEIDIYLQPAPVNELSLEPLITWVRKTFGEVDAQVFLDESQPINAIPELMDDSDWIYSISSGSWTSWLQSPVLPKGEAKKAAQLLKQLAIPTVVMESGMPPPTQALLQEILDTPPSKYPDVEWITARILLFCCNFLALEPQVASIYDQAAVRLQNAIAQMSQPDQASKIDLLIPSLFMDINTAKSIWRDHPLPVSGSLDTFNIQNLLYAFEPAWRRAIASGSNTVVKALRPILAILIGDLNFFAPRFGTWLLAHWCELVHGQSVTGEDTPSAPDNDQFLTAWLAWRQQLLGGEGNTQAALAALEAAAQSPLEQARVELERGYGMLVMGQTLEPTEWLNILDTKAGMLSPGLPSEDVDPIPWIPILRSLAQPLLEKGEHELAYQCLVASALPSSRTSAFDRLAFQVNNKQSVIWDLLGQKAGD
ncbi:MAG TPA: hypothetical protein DDZ80_14700, partial [Cyanobacteria bacterium UBA8803]|nr:hypothetical protein [Cyanobacteria bacterium UBA8803]